MTERNAATARAVALAGPCGAGKTQLLEALVFAAGDSPGMGDAARGTRIGDRSPEASARGGSTELNVAGFSYLGERFCILDVPGAADFRADGAAALRACDAAIVVAEPDPARASAVQDTLIELDSLGVPHMLFVNKMDQARGRVRDLHAALQEVSPRPLVLRQIPLWEGEHVAGYVDLALERAYIYRPGEPSRQVDMPSAIADREADARFQMLERLADADDALLEMLLEDQAPDVDLVCADLTAELRAGRSTPVFLGSALTGGGVRRLLKALRHETPDVTAAANRLCAEDSQSPDATLYVVKARHAGAAGKVTIARVLSGQVNDGDALSAPETSAQRVSGLAQVQGETLTRIDAAGPGMVVALPRFQAGQAGVLLAKGAEPPTGAPLTPPAPVYAMAVAAASPAQDVKMSTAMAKLLEEDTGLTFGADPQTGEFVLAGQGEVHVRTALARAERLFQVALEARPPAVAFCETLKKGGTFRGRHKKQSGGHGQFGDVLLEVRPLERGAGFVFDTRISGGVVPRQYFSAVEEGCRDALQKGTHGYPVVDVGVTLVDGAHHAVDSSEIAFRTAARIGVQEALSQGGCVLLEPMHQVQVFAPSEAMSRVTGLIASRRGKILGFDARPGWPGWDVIDAHMPHAEMADLIIELRAVSQGEATFTHRFDHHAPLSGKAAEAALATASS